MNRCSCSTVLPTFQPPAMYCCWRGTSMSDVSFTYIAVLSLFPAFNKWISIQWRALRSCSFLLHHLPLFCSIWSAGYHHSIEITCSFELLLVQRSIASGKCLFYQLVEVVSHRILQYSSQGFLHPLSWDLWFLCKIDCIYGLIPTLCCTYFLFFYITLQPPPSPPDPWGR